MAEQRFPVDSLLFGKGQAINNLYLIVDGTVEVINDYGSYTLNKGDVAGLTDVYYGIAHADYQATDDVVCRPIVFPGRDKLPGLITALSDGARIFVASMARQICKLYELYQKAHIQVNTSYGFLKKLVTSYTDICTRYSISQKNLSAAEEFQAPVPEEMKLESWLIEYYRNYEILEPEVFNLHFSNNPAICVGFIMKAAMDVATTYETLRVMMDYMNDLIPLFLDESGMDFYDIYTSLYLQEMKREDVISELSDMLDELTFFFEGNRYIDKKLYKARSEHFKNRLAAASEAATNDAAEQLPDLAELDDTARKLGTYAGWDEDEIKTLADTVVRYRNTTDKTAQTDDFRTLRVSVADHFFRLYRDIFIGSMNELNGDVSNYHQLPVYVRMFLLYGFMDLKTAGEKNALYMMQHCDMLPGIPEKGIYSFFEWLFAIFTGEKEPSRSDLDIDYADYLRDLKHSGRITAKEESDLLSNSREKVLYELNHAFVTVSKVLSGHPTTFCPIFSEHNLFREIENCEVGAGAIMQSINLIRSIDYMAYMRETLVSDSGSQPYRFNAHVEVIPDIILMPTIGTRGIMWQEIEGKKRTTPCRMFMPLFTGENVTQILLRLTGEYRWEMCKRVQGVHWNDVSDPSLTADYSDYLQYYKKNNDLTQDAKDRLKLALTKFHNSYKECFVNDYMAFVLFEGNSSPRLNRIARRILFTYCPFSAGIRTKLAANPLFKEGLDRYQVQKGRQLHTLENLYKKLKASGAPVPPELESEIKLWEL